MIIYIRWKKFSLSLSNIILWLLYNQKYMTIYQIDTDQKRYDLVRNGLRWYKRCTAHPKTQNKTHSWIYISRFTHSIYKCTNIPKKERVDLFGLIVCDMGWKWFVHRTTPLTFLCNLLAIVCHRAAALLHSLGKFRLHEFGFSLRRNGGEAHQTQLIFIVNSWAHTI